MHNGVAQGPNAGAIGCRTRPGGAPTTIIGAGGHACGIGTTGGGGGIARLDSGGGGGAADRVAAGARKPTTTVLFLGVGR